jgi:hypothetical protein
MRHLRIVTPGMRADSPWRVLQYAKGGTGSLVKCWHERIVEVRRHPAYIVQSQLAFLLSDASACQHHTCHACML